MLAISREIALKFSPIKAPLADVKPCPPAGSATAAFPAAKIAAERKETKNFGYRGLQAISGDIGRRFMPTASNTAPEILLLPVDPLHLYAYWNSGPGQPSAPESQARRPLTLRIYWRPNTHQELSPLNPHFDVPAGNPENRKKIRLPIDDTNYSAALGRLNPDHSLEVLAHSNLIHVPVSPGKKRFAPQENTTGEEPMHLLPLCPEIPGTTRAEGLEFAGSSSMHSNPDFQPDSTPEITEPMSFFNETAPGSERNAEREPESPFRHASGRGL
jgi:hypothetical protein